MATRTRKPAAKKPARPKRATYTKKKKPRPKRVKVEFTLFHCGKCGKGWNNPLARLFHDCLLGWSDEQKAAVAKRRTAAQRQAARENLKKAREAKGGVK